MTVRPSWNDLFRQERFHWKDPDEGLIETVPRWKAEGRRRVYDLGCGAGRHMAYLQLEGFITCGSDVAPTGLDVCRRYLREAGLAARVVRADMTACPFASETFDAAVSTNVLNHNPRPLLDQTIADLWRVLRPGGEVYLTVLSTRDWRCGSGAEVAPDTWVLGEGPEAGILHTFFSEGTVREWLSAFEITELRRGQGHSTSSQDGEGQSQLKDFWAVWARRPA